MKTSEAIRVVFSPFRTPVSLYAIQKTCTYWCKFPANNHDYKLYNVYRTIIIRIWGSVDLKNAEKIFGRHKAQNLNQSNLLLVQIFGKLNSGAKGSGDINCIDSSRSIYGCQGNCYYCVHTLKIKLAHSGSKQMRKSP